MENNAAIEAVATAYASCKMTNGAAEASSGSCDIADTRLANVLEASLGNVSDEDYSAVFDAVFDFNFDDEAFDAALASASDTTYSAVFDAVFDLAL